MRIERLRRISRCFGALAILAGLTTSRASGQDAPELAVSISSARDLPALSPHELDALYRRSPAAPMPAGKVRGLPILRPGRAGARALSQSARVYWQGKIFRPEDSSAVNRFLGLRMIAGEVYLGESRLDGAPALILDYSRTSRVYAPYRDEIREVAPGVLLGLMFDERDGSLKRYFALETGR